MVCLGFGFGCLFCIWFTLWLGFFGGFMLFSCFFYLWVDFFVLVMFAGDCGLCYLLVWVLRVAC